MGFAYPVAISVVAWTALASSSTQISVGALMRPVWDQFITTPAQQDIVRRIRDMREG